MPITSTFPLDGSITVDNDLLDAIARYFGELLGELRKHETDTSVALTTSPLVRTGAAGYPEGSMLRTDLTAVLTNLNATYGQLITQVEWLLDGLAYVRRETESVEEIAAMSGRELLAYLVQTGSTVSGPSTT